MHRAAAMTVVGVVALLVFWLVPRQVRQLCLGHVACQEQLLPDLLPAAMYAYRQQQCLQASACYCATTAVCTVQVMCPVQPSS